MSLEDIKSKIIGDARKEAERILKEAEERREKILKKARDEIDKLIEEAKSETEELKRREIGRRRVVAELENKKQMLAAKRRLLDEVFEEARKQIENLSRRDYLGFFEKLLDRAVEAKSEKVILGKEEKLIDAKFIESLNKKKGWNLRLSRGRGDFKRGLILSRGDVDVNLSLEAIFRDIREKWEDRVVEKLFPEEVREESGKEL